MSATSPNLASFGFDSGAQAEVIKALENPSYVWRTVDGLATETKLPKQVITSTLEQIAPDVLVTSTGTKGRLFTTRRHYQTSQSFLGKFLSSIAGKLK